MEDKIKAGVENYIARFHKEQLVGMLSMQYQNPNKTENEKKECYETIKALLIELYGLSGIMNNV